MKFHAKQGMYFTVIFLLCASQAWAMGPFRGWPNNEAPLRRLVGAEYDDGRSSPRESYMNVSLPGARRVSNLVSRQARSKPDRGGLNSLFWTWGQFIDHDMVEVKENEGESFNIPVPPDNTRFSDLVDTLSFKRSKVASAPGRTRQQLNSLTPAIDGSQVYGSTRQQSRSLRADGGRGYLLETSRGDLLKWDRQAKTFVAGDDRVVEQPTLTAMHTIFLREHNRLADILKDLPSMTNNETIYQTARLLVGAEIQTITQKEFLPRLVGERQTDFRFRRTARTGVFTEFSTACFRFGHTMVPSDLLVANKRYCNLGGRKMSLRESFFNPGIFRNRGIDAILRGTVIQRSESLDLKLVSDLRDFLFESRPGMAFGVDLASFNIQRGRDHGLPNYCAVQKKLGFKSTNLKYRDVTSNRALANALTAAYGEDPCAMDLWVAALAEDRETRSLVGKTCKAIIKRQFEETFRSDRFEKSNIAWRDYGLDRNPSLGGGLRLGGVTLSKIIKLNSDVGESFPGTAFNVRPTC